MLKRLFFSLAAQFFMAGLAVFIAWQSSDFLTKSDFEPSLAVLQNMSAAVFTLAGIWIAYLYPEAIKSFTNPKKVSVLKGSDNAKRIENLVLIIFTSAFVLLGILFLNLAFPILEKSPVLAAYKGKLNVIYIGVVIYLSLNQMRAIWGIMVNNFEFVYRLSFLKTNQALSDDLKG